MTLEVLTLHNLASIADATIDFTAPPLAGEPIFLITGPTGAGKTTLLDAISLALFARTPRMERTGGKEKYEAGEEKELAVSDNRQLLRRGTAEAFAELQFLCDGTRYRAQWAVRRARKKATGSLMRPEHTLQNIATGETTIKNTASVIEQLLRMTYEQFCRTSILAQGEFTKFLASSATDKSEILEKLTGTEIYSRIGRKIYDMNAAEQERLRLLKARLGEARLLTGEQREALAADIAAASEEEQDLVKGLATLTACREWLSRLAALQRDSTEAQLLMAEAEQQMNSETFSEEERTMADYQRSAQARSDLADAAAARQALERETKRQKQFKAELQTLTQGLLALEAQQRQTTHQLSATDEYLAREARHEAMYGQYQTIVALLRDVARNEGSIRENNGQIGKHEQTLPVLLQQLHQQEELTVANERTAAVCQETIKVKSLHLQMLNPAQLQASINTYSQSKNNITNAIGACRLLDEKLSSEEATRKELAAWEQKQKEAEEALVADQRICSEAQEDVKRWKEANDKASLALKNWAQEARRKLAPGDTCPVCGQTVGDCLPTDSHFKSVLEPIENALDESNRRLREAEALQSAHSQAAAEAKRQTASFAKKLQTDTAARQKQQEAASAACTLCGVDYSAGEAIAALRQKEAEADKEIALLQERQKEANALQGEIDAQQKQKALADKAATEARNKMAKTQASIAAAKSTISNLKNNVAYCEEAISQSLAQAAELITLEGWREEWQQNHETFISRLTRLSNDFTLYRQQRQSLEQLWHEQETYATAIRHSQKAVFDAIPSWQVLCEEVMLPNNAASPVAGMSLSNQWQTYSNSISAWKQTVETLRERLADKEARVKAFLDESGLSAERLAQIAAMSQEGISKTRLSHESIRRHYDERKGRLQQLQAQMAAHRERLPSLPNGLTEMPPQEQLQASLAEAEQRRNTLRQNLGALQQQVKDDDARREQSEALQRQCDEQQRECDRWSRLNNIFGSKEGQKFRTIAQGFILGHLLQQANRYLRHFTDRYTLACTPGSLAILVSDSYRPGHPQAATILSGGETFMVSLSLALALSHLSPTAQTLQTLDTLFIDEGFGSLDGDCLQQVMDTLETLHHLRGRRVGIISHVEALRERIATKIVVKRNGSLPSEVTVTTPNL